MKMMIFCREQVHRLQQPDHSDENEFDEVIENTTSLIGTDDERSELLHEQDQAYFESLKQDQEKEEERRLLLEKELNDVERQERLRNVRRTLQLLQEPDGTEDHVVVSVRHITQGVVTRAFYPTSSLMQLYDWVG